MTSNIGSREILKESSVTEQTKEHVDKLLYAHFRPEFLNRIDAIVYFKRLSEKDIKHIATSMVSKAYVDSIQDLSLVSHFLNCTETC
jgi:ATP-dependent Clp protease ATP-binding subunit ClpB